MIQIIAIEAMPQYATVAGTDALKPLSHKLPLVLHEDDDLLAIHKPAGINTHKPDRFAQDGIHEWLQKQRPEWRELSILHRLDKETSGVMVFGKTTVANQSLTEQFERGTLQKTYLFLTPTETQPPTRTIDTPIGGKSARTSFRVIERIGDNWLIEARPATGRTHQVRIHAAAAGFPILGDERYGLPAPAAPRLMLHAWKLEFCHPGTGKSQVVEAPLSKKEMPPSAVCAREFRELLFESSETNSYRLISDVADGMEGLTVDRFGDALLVQRNRNLDPLPQSFLDGFQVFTQDTAQGKRSRPQSAALGPVSSICCENGLHFMIRMDHGFSPGLFLDQRENRRRLRTIAAGKEVLNCFAYTCTFSVAAAAGGGKTTSVDLSKSYLDWGRENFRANRLNPDEHDFIYGDVFDWLARFAKRGRQWDIVLLDPPTFGTTKKGRVFRAAKDYLELVRLASKLVRPAGTLFCSTNQRSVLPESFLATIQRGLHAEKRDIRDVSFETQPPDFRVAEGEKPYLKTFWLALDRD